MTLLPSGGLNLVIENLEKNMKKVGSRILNEKEVQLVHFTTVEELKQAVAEHMNQGIVIQSQIPDTIAAILNTSGTVVPPTVPVAPPPVSSVGSTDGVGLLNRLGISPDGVLTIDGMKQGGFVQGGGTLQFVNGNLQFLLPNGQVFDVLQTGIDLTPPVLSISPVPGTYLTAQNIALSSNKANTTIHYTLDGTAPTASSPVYSTPISIGSTKTIRYFGVDAFGNKSPVQYGIFTISIPDTTPPLDVTNLQVTNIASTSLTLTWTPSASNDAASYDILKGSTLLASVPNAIYNVTGLSSSTAYTFTVKARDTSNNVAGGITVNATTSSPSAVDVTPPNEVTNLAAGTITSSGLTLTWTPSTSTDIASYDVYKGNTLMANVTAATCPISGLTASTAYTFTVKGRDTSNNVSNGITVNATTSAQAVAWTYDFIVPQSQGTYNLKTDTNFTHTLANTDIYGPNMDGKNATAQLLELGVQDGTKDEPGQVLPRTGIDTFAGPSMHGGYQYDDSIELIYFDSMAMNPYYFRLVKYQ